MAPLLPILRNQPSVPLKDITTEATRITGSLVSDDEREHLSLPPYRVPTEQPDEQHPFFVAVAATPAPVSKRKCVLHCLHLMSVG